MKEPQDTITQFYSAFQRLDWISMQQCYHPDARFSDPVFPNLNSKEAKAMWHMLCENAKNFSLEFSEVVLIEDKITCRWDAWYTFSATGRNVHNIIRAEFKFKDGLIIEHIDQFNFWRWSKMALGWSGWMIGWTPFFQKKVQATARKSLNKFISTNYP